MINLPSAEFSAACRVIYKKLDDDFSVSLGGLLASNSVRRRKLLLYPSKI